MHRSLAVAVLVLAAASPARAHNYLEPNPEGETLVPDIAVSRVVYRVLPADALHRYGFSAAAGQEIFVQVLGPDAGPDALFHPAFALLARGHRLEPASVDLQRGRLLDPALYRDLVGAAAADGLLVVAGEPGNFEPFHEPFTGTDYRMRQTLTMPAPADGRYQIVVFDATGVGGRYVLATGKEERFGAGDLLRFPKVWLDVRRFMGESTAPLWVALGVLAAAALGGTAWAIVRLTR